MTSSDQILFIKKLNGYNSHIVIGVKWRIHRASALISNLLCTESERKKLFCSLLQLVFLGGFFWPSC
uniref:Uncharacterized protein n=1 Tax=Octopus bimaculoides TaxID=37653 RepID=A0A0L8HE79_OCTBM